MWVGNPSGVPRLVPAGKTRMIPADQEIPQMARVKPEEGITWTPGLERILRLPLWL